MTRARSMEVGICGTFDVANYGDPLFPLIAEAELRDRLGAVSLHRFSYHARTTPEWPFEVTSIDALPQMIHRLDGLLIGGGHLIRFDKGVAPGYGPPNPEVHHPTGYWLTPALIALQRGVPLVWNALSGGNDIPKWAHPLLETAFTLSRYVSVRDEASQGDRTFRQQTRAGETNRDAHRRQLESLPQQEPEQAGGTYLECGACRDWIR